MASTLYIIGIRINDDFGISSDTGLMLLDKGSSSDLLHTVYNAIPGTLELECNGDHKSFASNFIIPVSKNEVLYIFTLFYYTYMRFKGESIH